jgi:hypothetical protein
VPSAIIALLSEEQSIDIYPLWVYIRRTKEQVMNIDQIIEAINQREDQKELRLIISVANKRFRALTPKVILDALDQYCREVGTFYGKMNKRS